MFDWIKKVLKKQNDTDIVNLNTLIQIPDRLFYVNDHNKIGLIDQFKNKYLKALLSSKTIFFENLEMKNLQDDMNMSIDLLLYNMSDYENLGNHAPEELLIIITKLKLYLKDINNIETETKLRLVALNELLVSKKPSSKNKRIINNEISILYNTLIIFDGQRKAINREIESIMKFIELNSSSIDDSLINEKYNRVLEYTNKIISINKYQKVDNIILKVAMIEKDLEIYVYKHKKDIDKLLFELDEIDNIEKDIHNKKYLFDKDYFYFFYDWNITI